MPEKPRSIMRLHGERDGERRPGGDEKGEQRRPEHALVAKEIRLKREERAERGAPFGLFALGRLAERSAGCDGPRRRPLGSRVAQIKPSYAFEGQTLRALARCGKGFCRALRAQPCVRGELAL